MADDDFGQWKAPGTPTITSLDQIDPKVLGDLRGHFESVDPIRVIASQIIGQPEYAAMLPNVFIPVGINNSTAEEEFYGIDIPGGFLASQGSVLTLISATMEQQAVGSPTFTFEVSYGGQAMYRQTSVGITQIANEFAVTIVSLLNNYQQDDYVFLAGIFAASRRLGLDTVGMGSFWGGNYVASGGAHNANVGTFGGFATVDTTAKQRLSFTGQWSAASSDTRFDSYAGITLRVAY